MGIASLAKQKKRLGLRGTVRYLFAVIFPDEIVPTPLLKICQEAILARNGVVHGGSRDVAPEKLREYLASIRSLCGILAGLSAR
jgi:hypothetical protein